MKVFLSIADKRMIVGKTYTQLFMIKRTAWRYSMHPAQICCWRANIPTVNEDGVAAPRNKTLHRGKAKILLYIYMTMYTMTFLRALN